MKEPKGPIALFLVLVTLVAGCSTGNGTPATAQQTAARELTRDWHASLDLSGGFAGIRRQITVNADGSLIASDAKHGRKVERTLQSEQLTRLEALLTALASAPEQRSERTFPGRCADCITSRLNATFNGQHYAATARSGEQTAQPYADLIAQLARLLQETLAQQ